MAVRQVEYRNVAGMRTAVADRGEGAPVLFVHGNPDTLEEWTPFLDRAGELGRVIAPDLPGFGRSARPDLVDFANGAALPNSTVEIVGGVGHWCFREDPAVFDRVVKFLGQG
jgi:pimeloyl-ACP methyl ester carboxylesterase